MKKWKNPAKCRHERIKKNFPFGRHSQPRMFCKNCGKVLKPYDLM